MPSSPHLRISIALLVLACVAACVAVSAQSFWIDETQTALKAVCPTLRGCWDALYAEHDSNLQLPLYMVYIWSWARLFPVSELSLRAANIPWFLLGFFAIHHFLRRRPGMRNVTLLLYAIHPFVWYYLNEGRPYIMQLSGALLVAGAVFAALEKPEEPLAGEWWWLFGTGLVILCGTALLGVPWGVAAAILMLRRPGFVRSMAGPGAMATAVCGTVLVLLAVYFGWTLAAGARPTAMSPMSVKSIPFVFYEQLGFTGLGPGRADLRTREVGGFLMYLPMLCLLGAPLAYAFARAGAARFGIRQGRLLPICMAVLVPTVFVFGVGFARDFLVLGRHLTALFPVMIYALAFAISLLWQRRRVLDRAVVCLIVAGLAVSALEVRFAYRHQKDDNRDAVAIAKEALARGEGVWWAADFSSASYYGLPISWKPEERMALYLLRPVAAQLAGLPAPGLIVLCKPDLFDSNSATRDYLKDHGYTEVQTVPAFTIWTR